MMPNKIRKILTKIFLVVLSMPEARSMIAIFIPKFCTLTYCSYHLYIKMTFFIQNFVKS